MSNLQPKGNTGEALKFTEISRFQTIRKGDLNKIRLRPEIINEHQESSRTAQSTVTSSNIVGQFFKASRDNINSIMLTMQPAGTETDIDTFETYADSAALQVEWNGATNDATLEETIVSPNDSSTKSMRLLTTVLNDTWTNTISTVDLTNALLKFDYRQTALFSNQEIKFFIGDGTNTKSISIGSGSVDAWESFSFSETSLSEDQAGITDVTDITEIGFTVENNSPGGFAYVDNLVSEAAPGTVLVKLWDMGATLPVTAVTSLDDGTQYTTLGDIGFNSATSSSISVPLLSGTRVYHLDDFVAGAAKEIPTNSLITKDNYFAITIEHVDTDVNVYGSDPTFATQYYNNGFAFTAPDDSTAVTAIGEFNDLMFIVMSADEVFILKAELKFNSTPGDNSQLTVFVEDINMQITNAAIMHEHKPSIIETEEMGRAPAILSPGGKFEAYYDDDASDSITNAILKMECVYYPLSANG